MRASASLPVLLLVALGACGETPAQVLVHISADDTMRAAASSLRVRVCAAAAAPSCSEGYDQERRLDDSPAPLPATIPIGPPSTTAQRFWLETSLLDEAGDAIATLRAEGGFVAGERRVIRLRFTGDCLGTACGPRQTCLEGDCRDACYDPEPESGSTDPTLPGACGGMVDAGAPDAGPDGGPDLGPPCDCPCASDECVDGECVPAVSIRRIALAEQHSCVAGSDGVYCFGENTWGQLGLGAEREGDVVASPTRVALEGEVVDLSAGERNTCAVLGDGTLWCWGDDSAQSLGTAGSSDAPAPVRIGEELSSSLDFARVAHDWRHGCAVTTTQQAWCWGRAEDGQLGSQVEPLPFAVAEPTRITGISFDSIAVGDDFTCGLTPFGSGRCWGTNGDGEIAQPSSVAYAIEPTNLPSRRYVQIAADHRRACALEPTGQVRCWGFNGGNRSGLADTSMGSAVREPLPVAGEVAFRRIAVGREHTCGLAMDGSLWCWGINLYGQVGAGDFATRNEPVQVGTDTDWAAIGAGTFHSCAAKEDGRLFCWGRGLSAQLGASCGRDDLTRPCRVCIN